MSGKPILGPHTKKLSTQVIVPDTVIEDAALFTDEVREMDQHANALFNDHPIEYQPKNYIKNQEIILEAIGRYNKAFELGK